MNNRSGANKNAHPFAQKELMSMQTTIAAHPSVHDALVVQRPDISGERRVIAYIVPADVRSVDAMRLDLEKDLSLELPINNYVLISAIPRCNDGCVDIESLAAYEIGDQALIGCWQRTLKDVREVNEVEVLVVESSLKIAPLHRSDLLPALPNLFSHTKIVEVTEYSGSEGSEKVQRSSRLAVASGEPLLLDDGHPETLGDALKRAAEECPSHGVFYVAADGEQCFQSYPELLSEAKCFLKCLWGIGVKPGDKVIFQLKENRDFLVAFWASMLGGIVPVPVTIAPVYMQSNAVVKKILNAWEMLDKPIVLASVDVLFDLQAVFYQSGATDVSVFSMKDLTEEGDVPEVSISPNDLALLLLTSGSTGLPKAVMHSHQTLLNRSASSVEFNEFCSEDVSLNWMPLDHVGGIVMYHLRDVYAACQQIQVATSWILEAPLRWLALIDQYRVSITWAPNFAYALVNEKADEFKGQSWDLSCMRHSLNGGEAVVAKTARQFLRLTAPYGMSSVAIKPAWGMSETSSGITDSHHFSLTNSSDNDRTVDVGKPIHNISIRIVDENDEVIFEKEKGRLQVKGPCIMLGYYQNPDENSKAFTEDGWLDTGDIGYLFDGCLTVTARTKDDIIINGVNYLASEIEVVAEAVEGVEVSYSAACAVRAADSDTDELAVFIYSNVSSDKELAKTLYKVREQVASGVGVKPTYVIPLEKHQIPKTNIGKIQRTKLKKSFECGEFDAELKRSDLLTETNTIPNWFYHKTWFSKEGNGCRHLADLGVVLVFVDELGLGYDVCERLHQEGLTCITVKIGEQFSKLGNNQYCLDPESSDDYQCLIDDIQLSNQRINQILHCWTYTNVNQEIDSVDDFWKLQYLGLFSLLYLVRALAKNNLDEASISLHVFGSNTQIISDTDRSTCEHATVIGMLKTIPLEIAEIKCRHVDLQLSDIENNSAHVIAEIKIEDVDDEVAYRNGQRQVWGLSRVDITQYEPADTPLPLRHGGVYLITGGLGGIGSELAKYLANNYQAKLILIGTTELPEGSGWSECLAQNNKLSERLRTYRELESMGMDFIYQTVDVADPITLENVIVTAEEKWGAELTGIFHLASGGDPSLHWKEMDLYRVSAQSSDVYDWMFRSKIYGALSIHKVLKSRPNAINVSFSSVISLFGGATFSAYAAAQSFLNAYSNRYRGNGHPNSYCFTWSVWDSIGMSKGDPSFVHEIYLNAGYVMIPHEVGFDCLAAALYHNQPELVIGLDSSKANVFHHLLGEPKLLNGVAAFYTSDQSYSAMNETLKKVVVEDSFGARSQCDFIQIESMPLKGNGEIDRNALLICKADEEAAQDIVLPRTETEQRVASVWADVLATSENNMDINASFFQLGGNSLIATQVLSRLNQSFNVKLTMRDLFEYSTIDLLADFLRKAKTEAPTEIQDEVPELQDYEALLENLENMSDEEIAQLLGDMQDE